MNKQVVILTGEPTIEVIAEMGLNLDGILGMMRWVGAHRPECLPSPDVDAELRSRSKQGVVAELFPHDEVIGGRTTNNELLVELAGRKCLAAGTIVLTTRGPVPIEKVLVGDVVFTPRSTARVVEVMDNGERNVVAVETKAGYAVLCTPDHLLKTEGGWVEAGDLHAGDQLEIKAGGLTCWQGAGTFAEGYACGLFLGDGTFAGDGFLVANIRLFGDKKGLMSYVEDVARAKSIPHRDGKALSLNSKSWGESMRAFGVRHGVRVVTPEIEQASSEFQRGVLMGLFDTDGHLEVSKKTRRVSYCSSSRPSLEAVQRMLLGFGVCSRLTLDRLGGPTTICGVETIGKPSYKLRVSGDYLDVFADRVGSRRRASELRQAREATKRKSPRVSFGEVKDIYPAGRARVYDIALESGSEHSFSANGIVAHNCYDSFGLKAGRKTNAEYIANTQQGDIPHACYDETTEVLTLGGWKAWPDVTKDDKLATRTARGNLEYHRVEELVSYDYTGRMYQVEGAGVDLLVTPNHRMYVCLTSTRRGREREDFEFIEAEELGDKSHCYVKDAEWKGGGEKNNDVMRLLGFSIGDGYVAARTPYCVRFHLKRARKIEWLRFVCSRLQGEGFELRETKGGEFVVSVPGPMRDLFGSIYDGEGEKVIPSGLFASASRSSLEALWEGLLNSDGSVSSTAVLYSSTSRVLLDQVQQLLLHVGYAGHVHANDDGEACGNVTLVRRGLRPEVNRGASLPKTRWVEWSGRVYCAQVPNGTLYVRRNGIPVWCGNSILYHAKMTFFIAGVSRRVSHELIRNYVGADRDEEGSPSQESTRFTHHYGYYIAPPRIVDLEEISANEASDRKGHARQFGEFDRFSAAMQQNYDEYLAFIDRQFKMYGGDPKGMERKRIYEAASAYLSHACETSFVWTTNPMALAKLFRERCDAAADLEFQRFAGKWKRICLERWPNLFQRTKS